MNPCICAFHLPKKPLPSASALSRRRLIASCMISFVSLAKMLLLSVTIRLYVSILPSDFVMLRFGMMTLIGSCGIGWYTGWGAVGGNCAYVGGALVAGGGVYCWACGACAGWGATPCFEATGSRGFPQLGQNLCCSFTGVPQNGQNGMNSNLCQVYNKLLFDRG